MGSKKQRDENLELDEELEEVQEDNEDDNEEDNEEESSKEDNKSGDAEKDTGEGDNQGSGGQEEENQYKPNFRYVIEDDEFEIDEYLRPIIKDSATEAKVRRLLEKAGGLEKLEISKNNWKNKFTETESKYKELADRFLPAVDLFKQGKKMEAMLALFDPADLISGGEELKRLSGADEKDRKAFEDRVRDNIDGYYKNREVDTYKNDLLKIKKEQIDNQFDTIMRYDPQVKEISKWYDSQEGNKAGSFKNKLYSHGATQYNLGRELQPAQVVDEIIKEYLPFFNLSRKTRDNSSAQENNGNGNNNGRTKDRIPNAKSQGSVAGKVPFNRRPAKEQTWENAKKALQEEIEDIED